MNTPVEFSGKPHISNMFKIRLNIISVWEKTMVSIRQEDFFREKNELHHKEYMNWIVALEDFKIFSEQYKLYI